MTSLERVLTTLGHKEPDRVPFFLTVTMHGAKELGLTIKEYFSRGENVAEGQLIMREKYGHDFLYPFFYAAIEVEAWGGEIIFRWDGPPNSGAPVIKNSGMIPNLKAPVVQESAPLARVLKAISILKGRSADVPIIGVVMSPFSLPIMQMGFEQYMDLIYEERDLFWRLMEINEKFCVEWANAQLSAGASIICYYDPVSSTTVIPRELYIETGFKIAEKTLAAIKGPTVTHMAAGRCLSIIEDIAGTGTSILGVSALEDLSEVKARCRGKLTVLGNLNGIEMRRWTPEQTEAAVKETIGRAGPGGGFILSDNHGEIPVQVPEETLIRLSEAVRKWGSYPLEWVEKYRGPRSAA